ncbi:patatin-like phospholipase family protein [Vibrio wakamikoensis]|uniref:Patatin-like phospholipase family protein n=1 Tax=Vibrio chaetopteri TaxID=3016528 RepID=A0AAU8BQ24_9VIBR
MKRFITALVPILMVSACSTTHSLENRVSMENYYDAQVVIDTEETPSEPIRVFSGEDTSLFYDAKTNQTPIRSNTDSLNVLVLSGGGANGAYGAGVLNGLYDSGQFEDYSVVTGISAGALMAPFAFVGKEMVPEMTNVMLNISDKDIIGKRHFLQTLTKDALSNGDGLQTFIANTYSSELIEGIAAQHRAGKRLLIGTTQFDSAELVVWNLGAIANSSSKNKVRLIHQILAASASIPGVFPPQFIQVEENGKSREELHVDGGLANQMFLFADHIDYQKISLAMRMTKPPQVHVIRNGLLEMPYQQTKDKGIELITRTVKDLTVQQSKGDLYQILYFSQVQGLDVRFTAMGRDFPQERASKAMFDADYMQSLYQYGYQKVIEGHVWE